MGIPSYFGFLIRNHKEIVVKTDNKIICNNFYIDSNSIIYNNIKNIEYINDDLFENKLIENVINDILKYINIVNPNKNLYITFDGVPPLAKINQQKNRRYKTQIHNKLFDIEIKWDSCKISPGTEFMNKLSKKINDYFYSLKNKVDYNIIVSCSDKPGEGEHKIFEFIRNNPDIHKNNNTIVYGIDADLIMLSLNHLKYCNKLFLYRETPEFIKNIDNSLESNQCYYLSINVLGLQIYNLLNNKNPNNRYIDYSVYYNYLMDYVFLCFLCGNDFLPHFPSINIRTTGIHILTNCYKNNLKNKFLTNNNKIIWKNFKLLFQYLSSKEYELLLETYKHKEKLSKNLIIKEDTLDNKIKKYNDSPVWDRNIEKYINIYEEDWEYRYYYSLFHINNNEQEKIVNVCNNYLEMIEWNFNYYTFDCIDWNVYYKYNYPPLLKDLYKTIPYFDTDFIEKKYCNPINEYTLLSIILPYSSLYLLPNNIKKFVINNFDYKDNYEIVYAFFRYIWEGHIVFENIDITDFNKKIINLLN